MKKDLLITDECENKCYQYFHCDKDLILRMIQLDLDLEAAEYGVVLSTTAEAEYGKLKKRVKNRQQRTNFLKKRLRRDRWYPNEIVKKYVEGRLNESHVLHIKTILERLEVGDTAAEAVDFVRRQNEEKLMTHSRNLFGEEL